MKVYHEEKKPGVTIQVVTDKYLTNDRTEVVVTATEALTPEASLAAQLIQRWGLVAAVPDGEDSSGRSKVRAMTADELVNAACGASELAYKAFRERSWTMKIPDEAEARNIVLNAPDHFKAK